jgi:hypothetical protein
MKLLFMIKSYVLLSAVLLFTGAAHSLQAQTYSVGDYVETNTLGIGNWTPCRVSKPIVRNQYGLDCGATRAYAEPRFIRARAATAEDKRVDAETAAALARQPRPGSSVGAQYGTREPATCANRTAPAQGAPSPAQVRQYFICDQEGDSSVGLSLVADVNIQVAPKSHPADPRASYATAPDLNQPVWDIRGSFTQYACFKSPAALIGQMTDFARVHTCNATDQPTATGFCYKNNFGDWHCPMRDGTHANANTRTHVLPPAGN